MKIRDISYKDKLKKCLHEINIKEDIVLIHSSLLHFIIKDEDELGDFCKDLISYIGIDKCIIMPSFTPSFGKNKYWDYLDTKSEMGILTEYFRNNFSEERSIHPIHSVSIYNNKYNLKHESRSSFGQGSIWEWICQNDVCNLSLGIALDGGGTICHYAEEYIGIKYREFIDLNGKIFDKLHKEIDNNFTYFARKIFDSNEINNDWERCERDLIKNKVMDKKIFFNNIPVCKMNTKVATKFMIQQLKNNSNYFLEKNNLFK